MIPVLVFMVLQLQVTGTRGQACLSLAVRDGIDVNFTCRHDCSRSSWIFTGFNRLFTGVQKGKGTTGRVTLSTDCTLLITKVTPEDAGYYRCRAADVTGLYPAYYCLSVIAMAEQKTGDNVTLSCSLTSPDNCVSETVKWLYNNEDIDGKNAFMKTPPAARCSAAVTILNLTHRNISTYNFTCRVTTLDNQVHFFDFSPQSADQETNAATPDSSTNAATPDSNTNTAWFVITVLGLVALITAVVGVNMWTRAGKKAQTDENTVSHREDNGALNYVNAPASR